MERVKMVTLTMPASRTLLLASYIGIPLINILKSQLKCYFLFRPPKSLPSILQDFVNYLFSVSLLFAVWLYPSFALFFIAINCFFYF